MVPLVQGQWAEVRTVVIGEVQPMVQERGEWVVHTRNLSYFSRKTTAEAFTRLALVEIQRRGVENAKHVGAVMDGSDWLQGFTDYHCPHALRILDFPHAGEHVSLIGEFLFGEGTSETKQWIGQRLHQLKHEGPGGLLTELRELQKDRPDEKAVLATWLIWKNAKTRCNIHSFKPRAGQLTVALLKVAINWWWKPV